MPGLRSSIGRTQRDQTDFPKSEGVDPLASLLSRKIIRAGANVRSHYADDNNPGSDKTRMA
jgi:hypothetical protein